MLVLVPNEEGLALILLSQGTQNVIIETTSSLVAPVDWQVFWEGVPSGIMETISITDLKAARFFRARSQ